MFSLSARARVVVVALVGRAVVTSPWVSCMLLFESRLLVTEMSDDTLRVSCVEFFCYGAIAQVSKCCCCLLYRMVDPPAKRIDVNKNSPLRGDKTRLHINIFGIVARTLTEQQSFEHGLWLTRASSIRFRCKLNVKVMYKYSKSTELSIQYKDVQQLS
jgi:hypothetical protein